MINKSSRTAVHYSNATETNTSNNVDKWCSDNHMAINVTKSKLMLVSSNHNLSQLYSKHSNIPFHDSCIEVVTCEKLLGVYINSTLSWDGISIMIIKM